jgi:hypothetical protein
MIVFNCRGFRVPVYASIVTQTSKTLRKKVSEERKVSLFAHPLAAYLCTIPNIYIQTRRAEEAIYISLDWDPYCLDRIIDFWTSTRLNVRKEKRIGHPAASLDTVVSNRDAATSLTTLEVLVHIYLCAVELEDDALIETTLARMRHPIAISGHLNYNELLKCVSMAYSGDSERDRHKVFRRILLSGVIINMTDIWTGEERGMFEKIRIHNPRFSSDHLTGLLYYTTVYKDHKV